jgi:hypothetical protein
MKLWIILLQARQELDISKHTPIRKTGCRYTNGVEELNISLRNRDKLKDDDQLVALSTRSQEIERRQ